MGPLISGPFCVFSDNKPFLERVFFSPLRTGLPAVLQDVIKRWHLTVEIETLIDFSCGRKRSALCSISWPDVCDCPRGVLPWGELKRQNTTVHWNWWLHTWDLFLLCSGSSGGGHSSRQRLHVTRPPVEAAPESLAVINKEVSSPFPELGEWGAVIIWLSRVTSFG